MPHPLVRHLLAAALVLTPALVCAAPAPMARPACSPTAPVLKGDEAVRRNIATVQAVYAAFGSGDVPAILGCIADDAVWESWRDNHAQRANVPWFKPQSGRAGVAAFFAYVGAWKVNAFDVKNIMGAGPTVVAEIEVDFDVTQTGGRIQDQELHRWTFNDHGMITGLRHYADTAKHIAAAKGAR